MISRQKHAQRKSKKSAAYILLMAALLISPAGCGYNGPKITVQELNRALDDSSRNITVIDVRPAIQFKKGHIAEAVNYPLEELEKYKEAIRAVKGDVAVICTCGKKALAAAKRLAKDGVSVILVEGGYKKWEGAGYPLDKGG
jgi:rhodanese-related sulfurtransferase